MTCAFAAPTHPKTSNTVVSSSSITAPPLVSFVVVPELLKMSNLSGFTEGGEFAMMSQCAELHIFRGSPPAGEITDENHSAVAQR